MKKANPPKRVFNQHKELYLDAQRRYGFVFVVVVVVSGLFALLEVAAAATTAAMATPAATMPAVIPPAAAAAAAAPVPVAPPAPVSPLACGPCASETLATRSVAAAAINILFIVASFFSNTASTLYQKCLRRPLIFVTETVIN
jgi:hypothetical protein